MTTCPNCLSDGMRRFCPECGQESPRETTARAWLAETLDELFFVGRKLPRSLTALLISPGLLTVEWSAGRRARYVRPLRLFLLALALTFVYARVRQVFQPLPEGAQDTDFVFQLVLFLIWVPGFALFTRLALWESGPRGSLVPYVVFSLHTHSAILLISLVLNAATIPVELARPDSALPNVLPLGLSFAHLVLALRRWGDLTWVGAAARGILVALACIPLGYLTLLVLLGLGTVGS